MMIRYIKNSLFVYCAVLFSLFGFSEQNSTRTCSLFQIGDSTQNKFSICDGTKIRTSKKTYTARDYIQNGLLAIWDAKENVAYDLHSTDTQIWKDLSGHGYDLTVYYPNWWTQDSVVCDGVNRFASRESFIITDNLSIDCCYKLSQNAENGGHCVFYVSESGDYRSKKRFSSQSITRERGSSIVTSLIKTTGIDDSFVLGELDFARHSIFTYVNTANEVGSEDKLYIDGIQIIEKDLYEWGTPDATEYVGISIAAGGTFYGMVDWPFNGEINCIRVYNRKLTEEEVKYNAFVDNERFGK